MLKTEALVIRSFKYSDYDLIVKCYTLEFGLQSYIIKGFYSKRKKEQHTLFQPLNQLEIVSASKLKELNYIKEVRFVHVYQSFIGNIKKNSLCFFIAEILQNCLQKDAPNPSLFSFLKQSLLWVDTHDEITNFIYIFLLKLSSYLGFAPNTDNSHFTYFSLENGTFCQITPTKNYLSKELLSLFKELLNKEYSENIHLSFATKNNKRALLKSLIVYLELHLNFSFNIKSLDILYEVFDT